MTFHRAVAITAAPPPRHLMQNKKRGANIMRYAAV